MTLSQKEKVKTRVIDPVVKHRTKLVVGPVLKKRLSETCIRSPRNALNVLNLISSIRHSSGGRDSSDKRNIN